MTNNLDHFYLNQTEPQRSCFLAMRSLVLNLDDRMIETKAYGMPCFKLGKKVFCYLWKDKQTEDPYFLMAKGNQLEHPALQSGDRKRMKVLPVNPTKDLPLNVIQAVFEQALALY